VFDYPDDTVGAMRRAGYRVYDLDAGEIARELEDRRLGNTIMLGAIADHLPFDAEQLRQQVVARFRVRKPALVALNERAFDAGRKAEGDRFVAVEAHQRVPFLLAYTKSRGY